MHALSNCVRNRYLAIVFVLLLATCAASATSAQAQVPGEATAAENLSSETAQVFVHDQTLWLKPTELGLKNKSIQLPRLCAPIRSATWVAESKTESNAEGAKESKIDIKPEPTYWIVSFQNAPSSGSLIRIELDAAPLTLDQLDSVKPSADGSILLHAYQATTYGDKLRFEPQWFKNTVGYWTVQTDHATWKLRVDQPGVYAVAVLQGCGAGQGGSDAKLTLTQESSQIAEVNFKVIETGHFQNFRWVQLGTIKLDKGGEYELDVAPVKIAKAALGDIRMIHLVRQATP